MAVKMSARRMLQLMAAVGLNPEVTFRISNEEWVARISGSETNRTTYVEYNQKEPFHVSARGNSMHNATHRLFKRLVNLGEDGAIYVGRRDFGPTNVVRWDAEQNQFVKQPAWAWRERDRRAV